MSSRDALRACKPQVHRFDYGGQTFHVRALSGAGRARFLALNGAESGPDLAKVVALALCSPSGELEYDLDNDRDVREIAESDGDVLQAIVLKLYEVSGLSRRALDDAEKKS